MRVKRGVTKQRRHGKILKAASGFRAATGCVFRAAFPRCHASESMRAAVNGAEPAASLAV